MNRVIRILSNEADGLRTDLDEDRMYASYLRDSGRHREAEVAVHRINENEARLSEVEDAIDLLESQ